MMPRNRRGFSLMEVMLATSVLLGSSVALIELATIGRKQANSAYDLTEAQLLCQAKLDEIVAGIESPKAVEDQELVDNPGWLYSVEVEPTRMRQLFAIKVSVFQEPKEGRRSVRFTLVRWLPNAESSRSNPLERTELETGPAGRTQRDRPREDRP